MVPTGRLIPTLRADGYTQMALDRLLLEQCQTSGPVLRFYQWEGPWLSLGRHQQQWPHLDEEDAKSGDDGVGKTHSGAHHAVSARSVTWSITVPSVVIARMSMLSPSMWTSMN